MRTTRRSRKLDPLANLLAVRSVCDELQKRCPDIVPKTDKQSLLRRSSSELTKVARILFL